MERDVRDGTVSPQVEPNEARAGSKSTGVCAHMHGRKSGGSIVKRVSADKSCDYPPILCHSEERLRQSKAPLLEMEEGGDGGVDGWWWGGINGGMKEGKVSRSPAAEGSRQRGDGARMSEVPRESPGSLQPEPAASLPAGPPARLGELPCGAQQFYSTLLLQEPPPGEGGGGGVQIIHRECF